MRVDAIRLKDFRNYRTEEFSFSPSVNIITGNNGQGKTNLLEAVFILSTARSFRTASKKDFLRDKAAPALIAADIISRDREFLISAEIKGNSPSCFYTNGIKCKNNYEICGILNTVLFSPDDLSLVYGGAVSRRRFLDMALIQLRPAYAGALKQYNRNMENKQRILKDGRNKPGLYSALFDFSAGMAKAGAVIIRHRASIIGKLMRDASEIHRDISDGKEKMELFYKTVSSVLNPLARAEVIEKELIDRMEQLRPREIEAGMCLTGPHRDEIEIMINGKGARMFGSRGQARTAALSLKLAERRIFFEDTGEYPVLLLDDVLSELDRQRQDFVLNRLTGGQVFITCCEEEKLIRTLNGAVYCINDGKLSV